MTLNWNYEDKNRFQYSIIIISVFNNYYYLYISWSSFTGVRVTVDFLGSLGLVWVFKSILSMLKSGWSQFFSWFHIYPLSFPSLWGASQAHQILLVSLSLLYSTVLVFTFVLWQDSSICHFAFFYFPLMARWDGEIQLTTSSYILLD